MKKLFFAALLAVAVAGSAFAADTKISSAVLSSFKNEFKQASNVSWKTGAGYTKASFTLDNQQMEVFYNAEGNVIASSRNIGLDELPVRAKRNFSKHFTGYTVNQAIKIDGEDEKAYYISAENEKESVIVKIDDADAMSIFQKTKK